MVQGDVVAFAERFIPAPRSIVWALVADTNRLDRASGLAAARYAYETLTPGDPTRTRVASARQLGITTRWVEPPYEWLEGYFVRGSRRFLQGPVAEGETTVELEPEGDGTRVTARTRISPRGALGALVARVVRAQTRTALERYLAAIARVLSDDPAIAAALAALDDAEPPSVHAARVLVNRAPDALTSGPVTPGDEAALAFRAERFAGAPVAPEVRARLVEFLRVRPDEELAQMRPFELARAWGADRREVLRAFLHAARAGLLDLRWQLNCPTCRVGAESASTLDRVDREAHCAACNVDFGVDFAEHIEAVFQVNPAVRRTEPVMYCESSPWFRPHVFAQFAVPPGATVTRAAVLPRGAMLARTLQHARRAAVDEAPPGAVTLRITADGITVTRAPSAAPQLTVTNDTNEPAVLLLERSGWHADIALGSVVATLPDFHDLFATEAPAAGVELAVGVLTLLFSDLTGSTAMYERLGDARAFAVVQEHFEQMSAAVAAHGGAIVKTMGDAVMATFASPEDAVRAALAMVEQTARAHGALGLSAKLGLHVGPCLAVRANGRLDFFGTTVNIAARLQAQAHGGQVVLMRDLLAYPGVAAVLRGRAREPVPFEAALKGIRDVAQLVAVHVGDAPAAQRTAS